jgi:hypothetical protein
MVERLTPDGPDECDAPDEGPGDLAPGRRSSGRRRPCVQPITRPHSVSVRVSGEGRRGRASSSWPLRRTSGPIDKNVVRGEWKKLATAQRDQIESAAPGVPDQVHIASERRDDSPVPEHGEHRIARELTQWAGR